MSFHWQGMTWDAAPGSMPADSPTTFGDSTLPASSIGGWTEWLTLSIQPW